MASDRSFGVSQLVGTEFRMQYRAEHSTLLITQADGGDMDPVELDAIAEVVRFVPA